MCLNVQIIVHKSYINSKKYYQFKEILKLLVSWLLIRVRIPVFLFYMWISNDLLFRLTIKKNVQDIKDKCNVQKEYKINLLNEIISYMIMYQKRKEKKNKDSSFGRFILEQHNQVIKTNFFFCKYLVYMEIIKLNTRPSKSMSSTWSLNVYIKIDQLEDSIF
jgi:hypothetical protein